jgi:crossover junction endodeoxyribonuclease RuvC
MMAIRIGRPAHVRQLEAALASPAAWGYAPPAADAPAAVSAFDLSLTSTGYATPEGSGVLVPPDGMRGIDRLRWIRRHVLDLARGLVVLEGYSFASRGRAIVSLGELGGVVRVALADARIPWVDVPPAVRCKLATGRGNAPKEAVLAAAIRRLGYAGHSHDVADASWLRQAALIHYGLRRRASPAPRNPHGHSLAIIRGSRR